MTDDTDIQDQVEQAEKFGIKTALVVLTTATILASVSIALAGDDPGRRAFALTVLRRWVSENSEVMASQLETYKGVIADLQSRLSDLESHIAQSRSPVRRLELERIKESVGEEIEHAQTMASTLEDTMIVVESLSPRDDRLAD